MALCLYMGILPIRYSRSCACDRSYSCFNGSAMRLVKLDVEAAGKNDVKQVLINVLQHSPHQALTIPQIRQRVKIVEQLEAEGVKELLLEDADHAVLFEAMSGFPWAQATKELLAVIDAVEFAEKVDPQKLRAVT